MFSRKARLGKSRILSEIGFIASVEAKNLSLDMIDTGTDLRPLKDIKDFFGAGVFRPAISEILDREDHFPCAEIRPDTLDVDIELIEGTFFWLWANQALVEHASSSKDIKETPEQERNSNIVGWRSDDWEERKKRVLQRDLYRCCLCGSELSPGRGTTHHIKKLDKGGNNHLTNLAGLCNDCHDVMPDHEVRHKQYFFTTTPQSFSGDTLHSVTCPSYREGIDKILNTEEVKKIYRDDENPKCSNCRPFETEDLVSRKRLREALDKRMPVIKAHLLKHHTVNEKLKLLLLAMCGSVIPDVSLYLLLEPQTRNTIAGRNIREAFPSEDIWRMAIDDTKILEKDSSDLGVIKTLD